MAAAPFRMITQPVTTHKRLRSGLSPHSPHRNPIKHLCWTKSNPHHEHLQGSSAIYFLQHKLNQTKCSNYLFFFFFSTAIACLYIRQGQVPLIFQNRCCTFATTAKMLITDAWSSIYIDNKTDGSRLVLFSHHSLYPDPIINLDALNITLYIYIFPTICLCFVI